MKNQSLFLFMLLSIAVIVITSSCGIFFDDDDDDFNSIPAPHFESVKRNAFNPEQFRNHVANVDAAMNIPARPLPPAPVINPVAPAGLNLPPAYNAPHQPPAYNNQNLLLPNYAAPPFNGAAARRGSAPF